MKLTSLCPAPSPLSAQSPTRPVPPVAQSPARVATATRAIPCRSRLISRTIQPSASSRLPMASACPCPNSNTSAPPGRSTWPAEATIRSMCSRPAGPENSAIAGSNLRTSSTTSGLSSATYGGLETTRSANLAEANAVRRSAASRRTREPSPWRAMLRRATASASRETSLAMTRRWGSSCASAAPRHPLPVPMSSTTAGDAGRAWASSHACAASTTSSVSGRGMSTAGVTSKSSPQNSRRPVM